MKIFIDRTACDCDLIIDEHIAEIRDGERVIVMDEDGVYEGVIIKKYDKNEPTWEWHGLEEVQKLNGQIGDISGLRYKKWDLPTI